jgi:hypothetical protein
MNDRFDTIVPILSPGNVPDLEQEEVPTFLERCQSRPRQGALTPPPHPKPTQKRYLTPHLQIMPAQLTGTTHQRRPRVGLHTGAGELPYGYIV